MPEVGIQQLKLERYGRWLQRAAGPGYAFAVFDADGEPAWASDGLPNSRVARTVAALRGRGFAWACEGPGMQRHGLNGSGTLYWNALVGSGGAPLGWIAALGHDTENQTAELDALADAMEDVAAAMRDEHRAALDLDSMANELADRYEELHLVYDMDRHLTANETSEQVFESLVRSCAEQLNVDVAAFVYPAADQVMSATNLSKPIHNLDLVLVEMRGDLYRFVFSSRESVVLNDRDDPRRLYIFTDMPYKVLACPVFAGHELPAMLVLLNHAHKPDFTNSDRRLGEVSAHQLSNLMHMRGMLHEMRRFNEQLAAALIEAVEAKDPYTRGHSERVHYISMEIGRALGLPPPDLENLFWGSLLHDVGKIGIPDAVLCKPGRLTRDEYTFIMVHPERSYEILRHIDRLKDAIPGARHHQEKYDGTGYPHGLKGKNIPLHGRIIAVADTYDSITSSRAYRPGRSHEAALKEIERVSGTQLDPDIVEVFKQICAAEPEWINQFGVKREHAGN